MAAKSLRIGYFNTQGFNLHNLNVVENMLNTNFDFIFIAETWFANAHVAVRKKNIFIAESKEETTVKPGATRKQKGMLLLGTKRARNMIIGYPTASIHQITFKTKAGQITGVYCPPSMDIAQIESILEETWASDILIGDINTRYDGIGPRKRVELFNKVGRPWQRTKLSPTTTLRTGMPKTILLSKLGPDHCFVKPSQLNRCSIFLLSRESLKLQSDHKYVIQLEFQLKAGQDKGDTNDYVLRFRIDRLVNKKVVEQLCKEMDKEINKRSMWPEGVNDQAITIERLMQRVASTILGQYNGAKSKGWKESVDEQIKGKFYDPAHTTEKDFKNVLANSGLQSYIHPTEEARRKGLNAISEIFEHLQARYTADEPFQPVATEWGEFESTEMLFFSNQAVADVICAQPKDRSCGLDGLHILLYKALIESKILGRLGDLFRNVFRSGVLPDAWLLSSIQMVPKKSDARLDANNLRPITIIPIARKIFEKLLLNYIEEGWAGQGWTELQHEQAGFRHESSTVTHTSILHGLLADPNADWNTAVFLDYRCAFDMVGHRILNEKLTRRGCPARLRELLGTLLRMSSVLVVNGKTSKRMLRTRGVPQGCPISPFLFNIFLDDLLKAMNTCNESKWPLKLGTIENCIQTRTNAYADDIVLISRGRGQDIQRMLDIFVDLSNGLGLELNVKKCGVITRTDVNTDPKKWDLQIDGEQIPYPKNGYTYLGFHVNSDGINFNSHLEKGFKKAYALTCLLEERTMNWTPYRKLRMYRKHIAPVIIYGGPLIRTWVDESGYKTKRNQALNSIIGKYCEKLLSWITGTNCSTNTWKVVENLCGQIPIREQLRTLRCSYQLIIDYLDSDHPLKRLITNATSGFFYNLKSNVDFEDFQLQSLDLSQERTANLDKKSRKKDLNNYITWLKGLIFQAETRKKQLTIIITTKSRLQRGARRADICFSPEAAEDQRRLINYRKGVSMAALRCWCQKASQENKGRNVEWNRRHTQCVLLNPDGSTGNKQRKILVEYAETLEKEGIDDNSIEEGFTLIDAMLGNNNLAPALQLLNEQHCLLKAYYSKQQI